MNFIIFSFFLNIWFAFNRFLLSFKLKGTETTIPYQIKTWISGNGSVEKVVQTWKDHGKWQQEKEENKFFLEKGTFKLQFEFKNNLITVYQIFKGSPNFLFQYKLETGIKKIEAFELEEKSDMVEIEKLTFIFGKEM